MNKTIGILAHVDAGKTTFSEQLLFHTNSIRERGRVDHRTSFLDSHEIEKNRGITVFSGQALMHFNTSDIYLIDTPGHVDFSPEMERAIQIMDYAVIIISGIEGVEGHTETVWRLLRKNRVPTFFFINKIDRDTAEKERVLKEIRMNLTEDVLELPPDFLPCTPGDVLKAFLAERDEALLERYLEGSGDDRFWCDALRKMILKNKVFPCASGSALHDNGIREFLESLDVLSVTAYSETAPVSGKVYKIRHDAQGVRMTFFKLLSGAVTVRDAVTYHTDGEMMTEKITQIRLYNGDGYVAAEKVTAGQLVAVTGLTKASIGSTIGGLRETSEYQMIPALQSKVVFDKDLEPLEILRCLKLLEAEEPSLSVTWNEQLREMSVKVMGVVQIEVLSQILKDRFGLEITFRDPEILYKETIQTTVKGYGHFEPLRHYAEVHLKLEPGERNSGVVFINACEPDVLTKGHQNLIQQHILEKEHHGLLTGSALTDVKVSLLTGRAHVKHTTGGDFREATLRALRQALEKAENRLLEPWYRFMINVTVNHIGRVLSDIQKASGVADIPVNEGMKATITGRAPVATFMNYAKQLTSFTGGKGIINLIFDGYYPCHNENEIIERVAYDKNSDPEYTSSSVFCSKGKGYSVSWDEAEGEMHCL